MTIGIVAVTCLAALVAAPPHRHNDVHLEANQISREGRVSVVIALGPSGLDGDVPTFDVAQLAETLAERFEAAQSYRVGGIARIYVTHPGYLPRLRLGSERPNEDADGENDREPDQPHGHLDGGWLPGSLAERRDAHQRSAARARAIR